MVTLMQKKAESGDVKTIMKMDKAVRRKAHTPGLLPMVAEGRNGRNAVNHLVEMVEKSSSLEVC